MHVAIQQKFHFDLPERTQRRHLRDIRHLELAQRLTLFGLRVGAIRREGREVQFDLHRFGRSSTARLWEEMGKTVVDGGTFKLEFVIEPAKRGHFLDVTLLSTWRPLRWFRPVLALIFWLTVLEDSWYWK